MASIYKNLGNNQLFCAAETRNGETDFRINRYMASGETFLEIYNSSWSMMPGNVGFKIEFDIYGENYSAKLRGRSWGDSYTHDFTDVKNYQALLGMIAQSKSLVIKNSNDAPIAEFDGSGAGDAVRSFIECVNE